MKNSFDGAQEVKRLRLIHCAHYRAGKNFSDRKWFLPILHTLKKGAVAAKEKSAHIASALQVLFDAMIVLLCTFWRLKMIVQTGTEFSPLKSWSNRDLSARSYIVI